MNTSEGLTQDEWRMLVTRAQPNDELALALRKLIELNEHNSAILEELLSGR